MEGITVPRAIKTRKSPLTLTCGLSGRHHNVTKGFEIGFA